MTEKDRSGIDHDAETRELPSEERPAPKLPPLPRQIGDYHIKRVIASGGMGVVYEAVQQHPRRTVALKIMKQGLVSRSALRRFEYESQILARLRHPGIAEVYEAGMHETDGDRVPYFAMEYIVGAKDVIRYAQAKGLGTRQKLDLFLKISEAVHHGHQKGIIHRDLKPANILVDSFGQPKIIDFGVARATDSDLAVTTVQTNVGQLVGTVQYMSPEQIDADPHDIDTRSDVYALGVVLYELLTGRRPYEVSRTVIYEATRIIREQQPARLSSIDSTLRGDVETIVLHALEKDRDRRYQSAVELAHDIRRFLDNRTIMARPPSLAYHCRTFVRRNKVLVTAVVAVFAALVLGIVGTSVGMIRARTEAATYTAVSGFFEESFASLEARRGAGPRALVRELLDEAAANIDAQLGDQPEVQARLRWSIGNGYKSLTLFDEAERQLRAALATQRIVHGDRNAAVARTLLDLGATLWFKKQYPEAETLFAESLATRRVLFGEPHEAVARSLDYLAAAVNAQGRREEAEELYRQALAMRRALFGDRHEDVAQSKNNLATCLWGQERFDEAEQYYRDAIEIMRSLRGAEHVDVARGVSNLALLLAKRGQLRTAESLFREALSIKRKALGDDHADVAITLHHLADLLADLKQYEEAEALCREALAIQAQRFSPPHLVSSTRLLGRILLGAGDLAAAEEARRELVRLCRVAYEPGDWRIADAESGLGEVLTRRQRYEEAEGLLAESYERLLEARGPDRGETVAARRRLDALYEAWGKEPP